MDHRSEFTLTINGRAATTSGSISVIDPAKGKPFATAPSATAADLDAAVWAAQSAFQTWKSTAVEERCRLILQAAQVIADNADDLAHLFVREQGRPFDGAKGEILQAAFWMSETAKIPIPVEIVEDSATRRIEVHHEPLGVVGAIVPWNFPVLLASWKLAPALLTGNTVILKPSPFTPLCTLKIGELLRPVFPPGVLNVISGGDDLGPMMTSHPGIAKISFTGSTATGKRVMVAAADDLKRITLELGGNDAAIVLPDVDVDQVAEQLFFGAFFNTAQICVASKRLYIHDDIYDRLRDLLHAIAQGVNVGDGSEQGSVLGPIQNELQFRRVRDIIDDARSAGLTLLEGKATPQSGGYFVPVTLVDNPPDDARVVVEEAFGPILPLLRFNDVDDVIRRANDTIYGLAGAVWSKDVDKAVAIAHRLDTGTVWINQNLQSTPNTPLSGHRHSGFGVENGLAGLLEYTQTKAIYIPTTT